MMTILRHLILFPIYLVQAAYVYVFTPRLPEPDGDRTIILGNGKPVRLLIVGDSSAAGVGAQTQDQVLLGRLCKTLGKDRAVAGTLWAKSGATVASTLDLLADMPADQFDIALVSLGINDAKNGVRFHRWLSGYADLIKLLQERHGVQHVFVSGLAPIREFPVLPTPLRHFLGDRAEWFDSGLETMVAALPGVKYLPLDLQMDVSLMSPDGFHPGPEIYAAWSRRVAKQIKRTLRTGDANGSGPQPQA